MGMGVRIVRAGPGVSLQDRGRTGFLRYGVNVAGPMDPAAFATARHAIGGAADGAAIEVSLGGIEIMAEGCTLCVAVAGGAFNLTLGDQSLPPHAVVTLEPGTPLRVRAGPGGMWCYLAFAAELSVPKTLGSVATHVRTGIGGIGGRALSAGDFLPIANAVARAGPDMAISAPWLETDDRPIRVMPGPQHDHFLPAEVERFLAETWTVSKQSDRMGCFLDGPPLKHRDGFNIVSDGITMGAIQVPGSGRPLVLMADRQPTGGYPKIANIIWADLGRFAQLRVGDKVRFEAVTWDEAVAARRRLVEATAGNPRLEPLRRTTFTPGYLLGRNLVGGVWAGDGDP